ncbi:MAG TPA: hypothetical protein VK477_11835, partial [Acidobacteriota bacterium]|nr:hypothetical protein [Acidobacteriota bacterium]
MSRPADFAALSSFRRAPNRALSVLIFIICLALMYVLRLVWFRDANIGLSYGLPLLLCLWHRDRVLLWSMTIAMMVLAAYKLLVVLPPPQTPTDPARELLLAAQWFNTAVVAAVVHVMLNLLERLERKRLVIEQANHELAERQEEIARQNEELQAQSEELAQQNARIQQQAEEMQHQAEELAAQAEELQETNHSLARREVLLQTLMESLHLAEDDHELPVRICEPV